VFINAVSSILTKYDLDLICTGSIFSEDEDLAFERLRIKSRVKHQFASEDDLKKLYEGAICFVYPSLYEGFGFPILEAFASNCPCLLSNASCFPEVAGDGAEYFDPYSVDDMRNAIEKVVSSQTLQDEMILRGRAVLQKYSWKKCAEETAELYNQL
jgi:glycosyltransferase involved in cell wall biosynthesis